MACLAKHEVRGRRVSRYKATRGLLSMNHEDRFVIETQHGTEYSVWRDSENDTAQLQTKKNGIWTTLANITSVSTEPCTDPYPCYITHIQVEKMHREDKGEYVFCSRDKAFGEALIDRVLRSADVEST